MGRDETKTLSDESLGSERRFLSETSPSVFFDMIRWILPKSDRIGNYTVFNGALTTIRRNRTGTVYYDQIDGELAHCSVLGRNYNILILNEAVVNGGSYKLTRYGEDIFLDTQAATTKPTTIQTTIKPNKHSRCGIQKSSKLKSTISRYTEKGYCWSCKKSVNSSLSSSYNAGSTRSLKPTGWKTSLSQETSQDGFSDKIYYADDKATSFDFPWFVRIGTGCFGCFAFCYNFEVYYNS